MATRLVGATYVKVINSGDGHFVLQARGSSGIRVHAADVSDPVPQDDTEDYFAIRSGGDSTSAITDYGLENKEIYIRIDRAEGETRIVWSTQN